MAQTVNRAAASRRKHQLAIVLGFTTAYLLAAAVGGILTHSLALLAEAAHMLTDAAGLGLALMALSFSERPATPERTFGYHRVEVLAALVNGVVLVGISFFILYEAYQRFQHPPVVNSGAVLVVGLVGLIVNLASARLLHAGAGENINLRAAYLEVLSDMLGAIGVLVAAVVIQFTHWYYADPLVSAGIGLFILPRTWGLMKEAVGVLLEGAPSTISLTALREAVLAIPGVEETHDLHVWSLTSGMHAMSVHATMQDGANPDPIRLAIERLVATEFGIGHVTVQLEARACEGTETHA